MSFLLKTILGVAAIETALLMLLVVSSNQALTTSLEEEMDKRAETTLSLLDASFRDAILSSDLATLESVAGLVVDIPDVVYVRISGPSGEILAESSSPAHEDAHQVSGPEHHAGQSSFHVAKRQVVVAGVSYATMEVHFSLDSAFAAREELQRTNLSIALSELLLVALFSSVLGFYLTRELEKLREASSAVTRGELGVEIPVKGSDEIAETIRSFNRMSRTLMTSKLEQEASEERLSSVLDGLRDGVCLLDEDQRVRFLNNQARIYLEALSPEWSEERPLAQLGDQSISSLLDCGYWRGHIEVEIEGLATWFDVSIIEVAHASPHRTRGDEWILTLQDVTEQKFRRERDQQSEKLATAGQLAAGIAHDFNNVLGTISAVADLYTLRDDDLPAEIKGDFETIKSQTQRASELVRQILDFGRHEQGPANALNLDVALRTITDLLRRTLPENVALSCEVDEEDLSADFDDGAFEQIVTNLVLNAADAMPEGGAITFKLSTRSGRGLRKLANPETHERWVCLEVEDDGQGIPTAHVGRIFDPFFTTKARSKGTGLGLAQVLRIVHEQGGDVEVESVPGRGTKFTLFLRADDPNVDLVPARREKPSMVEARQSADAGANAPKVLVVDDQITLLKTLEAMLENLGCEVLPAQSGAEALEIYESNRDAIDLVLTDAVMPGMDGFALISRIRASGSNVAIVVMSGHFLRDNLDVESVEADLDGFLKKPFGLADLRRTLGEVLGADGRAKGG